MLRDIDAALARHMVQSQFPEYAHLPITQVLPGGIDNRTFRLGAELAIRMPYAAAVAKEQRWLPVIARHVPLPVPEPVAAGAPGDRYRYPWSINRWMPGRSALEAPPDDTVTFARDLAGFLRALQNVDTQGAPLAGAHSLFRGADPVHYDDETRSAITELGTAIDGALATRLWEEGLATVYTGELAVDDGMWARGRAWTLWKTLITSNLEVYGAIVSDATR